MNTVTRTWKIYGAYGHRQAESFNKSTCYDWSDGDSIRIVSTLNADATGTNDYSIVRITRNTAEECQRELDGQISDGIFENYNVGEVEEI